jgi:hypothetical protein
MSTNSTVTVASTPVDYHTVRAIMDGIFVLCSWIIFFMVGWIFSYKKLFKDYEVTRASRPAPPALLVRSRFHVA